MRAEQRPAQSILPADSADREMSDKTASLGAELSLNLSDLDFGLESAERKSAGYSATIPGTSKTEITLIEALESTASKLEKIASLISERITPSASTTEKSPWARLNFDPLDPEVSPIQSAALLWSYPITAAGLGVAALVTGGFLTGTLVAALGVGMFLSSQPKMGEIRASFLDKIKLGLGAVKEYLAHSDAHEEASSIISKLHLEIEQKGFTAIEEKEFLTGTVSVLKQRASGYAALAEEVKHAYAAEKDARHELMRDKILNLSDFAEKAAVSRKLPDLVCINISAVTADPKIAEELAQFISKRLGKAASIERPIAAVHIDKEDGH